MAFEPITSYQNKRIKQIKKLRQKREREKTGLFVIDYGRDLQRALDCGYEPVYSLYCPELWGDEEALLERVAAWPVYEVAPDLMAKASYRQNPSGIVSVLKQQRPLGSPNLATIEAQHIVGFVDLAKPGNIGALLRTADAAGFGAVLLIDTALDLYNPNIIRSSTGACFLGNIYLVTTDEAAEFLQSGGYSIVAAHLDGDVSLYNVDFTGRSAIILGSEDQGLSDAWRKYCDRLVRIPMHGQLADSLNVSVSGAVMMYEALRQTLR